MIFLPKNILVQDNFSLATKLHIYIYFINFIINMHFDLKRGCTMFDILQGVFGLDIQIVVMWMDGGNIKIWVISRILTH